MLEGPEVNKKFHLHTRERMVARLPENWRERLKEVKRQETAFLDSFDAAVRRLTKVFNPANGDVLTVHDWDWYHSRRNPRRFFNDLGKRSPAVASSFDYAWPSSSRTIVSTLYSLPPIDSSNGMVLEALPLSSLSQSSEGEISSSISEGLLKQILLDRSAITDDSRITYFLILGSMVNWDRAVFSFLRNEFSSNFLSICLWNMEGYPVYLDKNQERRKYLDLLLPIPPVGSALRYTIRLLRCQDHASRIQVCNDTDLPDETVCHAFRILLNRTPQVKGDESFLHTRDPGALDHLQDPWFGSLAWPHLEMAETGVAAKINRLGWSDSPMEYIAAGEAILGDQPEWLNGFLIDWYPVTNAAFEEFVIAQGYKTQAEESGWSWVMDPPSDDFPKGRLLRIASANWRHPFGKGSSYRERLNHPVVHVSLGDAERYCEWKGKRLPTEAEWIRAARGNSRQLYPWGSEFEPQCCNTREAGIYDTTPVKQYPDGTSMFGLLDMSGNVYEWVNTRRGEDYLAKGGSWVHTCDFAQCSRSLKYQPNFSASNLGFRCARNLR